MRCHSVEISEALAQHVLEQMMCLHVREYKSLIRAPHCLFEVHPVASSFETNSIVTTLDAAHMGTPMWEP